MAKAYIKKMFPGAVTAQGFYSFYDYLIPQQEASHIFVIKGGPGLGKSTFMKKIGQAMHERGYDIEYHCCSSDNNSIDGVVIPSLGAALLDGTAPHVVDPKNPGAVDEIINFGEYWDEATLKKHKKEIMTCNAKISGYFQRAYFALQEAKIALEEWRYNTKSYQDWSKIKQMRLKTEQEILPKEPKEQGKGSERHLFAWGHTPQGKVEVIDTLLTEVDKLYVLKGQPGSGKSTFLAGIAERAVMCGWDVQFYHSTLDPVKLDLVIIAELGAALVIDAEPYPYTPNFSGQIITLDFEQSLNKTQLEEEFGQDILACQTRVNQHIERALKNSQKAKELHDLLENYYVPTMDFAALEKKYQAVLDKILRLAETSQDMAVMTGKTGKLKV